MLNNLETYTFHAWHGTLLAIAVILFVSVFNTLLATRLPLIEGILFIIHVGGLFAIIIPLWVMCVDPRSQAIQSMLTPSRAPRRNAHDTLFKFTTTGGWSNLGLSSLIGMVSLASSRSGHTADLSVCYRSIRSVCSSVTTALCICVKSPISHLDAS